MKKQNILISLLSIAFLVGCAAPANNNNNSNSSGEDNSSSSQGGQPADESTIVIEDFGIAQLEAEKFDVKDWEPDADYANEAIIENDKASGGAYLAAAAQDSTGSAKFKFELKKFSHVVFSAAYAQQDAYLSEAIEMDKTYEFAVASVGSFVPEQGKNVLAARSSASAWELMTYGGAQDLYPGTYEVTLSVMADAPKPCPSIDFVQFKTTDASATSVDPSTITADDIPDNDMRNLQQYKYILDSDVLKYKTYATGADLSAPRGMKLRFEDVDDASKYYVQVAESEADLADAEVREATNKYYMFQNAKLATKYYYRAATSEAGLASAEVKNITSTDVAPRVVYVPDVLNFRDIGGWSSSLVPGGKIKQGLYYRCAQLDAATGSTKSCLSSDGRGNAALKELGIKLDIDMRDVANQPNRGAGPSKTSTEDWPIEFLSVGVPSGSESGRWEGENGTWMGTSCDIAAQYVKIFNALAHCDEKPAMLHCTYGADRTGIATFFLEALLGMDMDDMIRDYLWTQFTQGRTVKYTESDAEFPKWIAKTNALEGGTFADKMENHLVSFYPEEQQEEARATMEHIREIFVPGYVAKA